MQKTKNDKSDMSSINDEISDSILEPISENALQYSQLSFEFEEKRENSLISQSSQMLTCFSIITAVLLMATPILIENIKTVTIRYILICLGVTLLLLVSSMILALLVQWRFSYKSLPSPLEIIDHMTENVEYFETITKRNYNWIQTINETWECKSKINDKRAKFISISMVLFLIAIAFIFLSTLIAIIRVIF